MCSASVFSFTRNNISPNACPLGIAVGRIVADALSGPETSEML